MTYVLPSTRAKRVKRIDQQGSEEVQAQDIVAFQAAADAAAQAANLADEPSTPDEQAAPPPVAITPREVIEKLHAARGELDVIVDLINSMEAQQYLGVANVALPSNLQQEQQQQALRLQRKVSQLKDTGSRLERGAAALRAHSTKDHFFFAQLAQLQQHWNLKRSLPGAAGHFQIDLALPLGPTWQLQRKEQQPDALIDVLQRPDGIIQLQSAGVTLPDRALRWLTPLSRPLPTPSTAATPQEQPPTTAMYSPNAVDTVMQEAQIDKEHQPLLQQPKVEHSLQQGMVQDSKLQQSGSNQAGTQPSAHATAPDAAQPSAPSSMVMDDLPPAYPLLAPRSQPDPGASFAAPAPLHQHLLTSPQRQLQTISVSAHVQEIVHGSALKCDRQLLAKQEEILVSLVQQRVEAEVREVQGPQDMDDGAVELADKVFKSAALPNLLVRAIQLRLLRLLLWDSGQQQRHSLLAELQS